MSNRFSRAINKINKLPERVRPFLLTKLFCSQVHFANTSKVKILSISKNKVVMTIKNRKKVQNHIGGVHALAAGLLAESASGIVFGINIPDTCLPLIKTLKLNYKKRMKGDLLAVATISDEDIALMNDNDKGNLLVSVKITDESTEEPIECEMDWAWVTKR
jgi:acyl-coenzyme A thioesterase PaaI-like protein